MGLHDFLKKLKENKDLLSSNIQKAKSIKKHAQDYIATSTDAEKDLAYSIENLQPCLTKPETPNTSTLSFSGTHVMFDLNTNLLNEMKYLSESEVSIASMTSTVNPFLGRFAADIVEEIQKNQGIYAGIRSKNEVQQKNKAIALLKEINTRISQRFDEAYQIWISGANLKEQNTQTAHSMGDILGDLWNFLSPQAEVIKAEWYKQEDPNTKVTQKQKIKFAIVGYKEFENIDSKISYLEDLLKEGRNLYEKYNPQRHPYNEKNDKIFETLPIQIKAEINFMIAFLEFRKKYRETYKGKFYEP